MTMIEAMSLGRVIVASRSGAIPEVITHEENGLLFEAGNWSQLKTHINRLLDDSSLRKSLGVKASERSEELKPSRELAAWLDVYTLVFG